MPVNRFASRERGAGGASGDRITLQDSVLTADSVTGTLQRTTAVVREFRARQEGGWLVGCQCCRREAISCRA